MIIMVKKIHKEGQIKITIEGPASAFKDGIRRERATGKRTVRVVHR
jgi:hypothetical protein